MKYIIYDVEIINAIPSRDKAPEPGITYCQGWEDHKGMGIATLVAYASWIGYPQLFNSTNLSQLSSLIEEADIISGHNILGFDNKILAAYGINIDPAKCYDTMHEIMRITGRRSRLEDVCAANFGAKKTDDGALAPILWQRGERLRVINYCMADVMKLSKPLFELIMTQGRITCPYSSKEFNLRHPSDLVNNGISLP